MSNRFTEMWIGKPPLTEVKFTSVSNQDDYIAKPTGGLWTSPIDERDPVSSPWLRWVQQERFFGSEEHVFLVETKPGLDVVQIDCQRHLNALLARYTCDDVSDTLIGLQGQSFAPLDFEAMAENHDGLHLTARGQAKTRMASPGLYGWDAACTLWFTWPVVATEQLDAVQAYAGGSDG